MKIAVYPGSFDPLTNGHVDVALRAARIFDEIIIRVADNKEKEGRYLFTAEERVALAKEVFKDYPNIKVVSWFWKDNPVIQTNSLLREKRS